MKKNIELIRLRGEMSCNQFASLLGISHVSLMNYECGRSEPSYSTWLRMKQIAKSNGIDLHDGIFCKGIKKGECEKVVLITDSLKTVRDYLGWTKQQMGEVMGICASGYARYERGEREPLASAWLKIKYHVQSYGIQLVENGYAEGYLRAEVEEERDGDGDVNGLAGIQGIVQAQQSRDQAGSAVGF